MRAFSTTNDMFNNAIKDISDNKRRAKQEDGKKAYRYQLATEDAVDKFYLYCHSHHIKEKKMIRSGKIIPSLLDKMKIILEESDEK